MLAHRNADSSESIRSSNGSPGWGTKLGTLLGRAAGASITLQRGELALQRALEGGEARELGEIAAPGAPLFPLGPRDLLPRDADRLALPLGEIERLDQRQRPRRPRRRLGLNGRGQREAAAAAAAARVSSGGPSRLGVGADASEKEGDVLLQGLVGLVGIQVGHDVASHRVREEGTDQQRRGGRRIKLGAGQAPLAQAGQSIG